MMTTISTQALEILNKKESRQLKLKLALAFNKTYNTIENWIKYKDQMLTTLDAVRIISEETGLSADQVLEAETQAA